MKPTIRSLVAAICLAATPVTAFADSVLKEGEKLLQGSQSPAIPGSPTTTLGTPGVTPALVPGMPPATTTSGTTTMIPDTKTTVPSIPGVTAPTTGATMV